MNKQELFLRKVKTDRPWFMRNFLKIRDKNANLIDFKINKAQMAFEEEIRRCERENIPKRFIILKARQMGFSTFTEGLIYHDTSTNPLKTSMIIAHEDSASQNLFNMSKLFYEEMPEVLKPMKKYANGKVLSFENPTTDDNEKRNNPGLRSKITVSTAGTVEVGRSGTIHNIHASEVAFFPDAKTTMLGLLQCVPDSPNTLVVLESTANGIGGYFYEQWQMAIKGESDFIPLFYPWFFDPSYTRDFITSEQREEFIKEVEMTSKDDKGNIVYTEEKRLMMEHDLTYEQLFWRKWAIRNKCGGDLDSFRQEYPSTPEEAFIASGRPVFDVGALRKYLLGVKEPERGYLKEVGGNVKFVKDPKGYLHIFEHPEPGKYYAIGADVAEGKAEGDYSVGMVGSDDFKVHCMWYGHIDPDLFGEELVKLAKYYNQAYLGVENNNHGLATIKAIQKKEYWNLYFTKTYDRITDKTTQKVGWNTNSKTKPLMIDKLKEFIREMYLDIPFKIVIMEMLSYIICDDGSTNAQQGSHDDTVMALAIMLQMLLEGKGENFEPYFVDERKKNKQYYDPLFEEEDDDKLEVCE